MTRLRLTALVLALFATLLPAAGTSLPHDDLFEDGQRGMNARPRRGDAPGGDARHTARVRIVDVTHVRARIEPDFATASISATADLTFTPLGPAIREVSFDQADLAFSDVQINGQPADYRIDNDAESITITLPDWLRNGETATAHFAYTATPAQGMFFLTADGIDPEATHSQLYTQGETTQNRHWLPLFDAPNEKHTSEMQLVAPAGMVAISNGELLTVHDLPGDRREFLWRESIPHAPYLISIVIGEFEPVSTEWDGIPITWWTPPGTRDLAENSFSRTPEMVGFFSEYFGVRYPWEKYDQTVIHRFRVGGMENTTLSNITDRTLHDDRAAEDGATSEWLVAHELAHQWFGDMVTMRSWPHIWLNEGFASYSECLWEEHARGDDELRWKLRRNRFAFAWADNRTPRPVVRHDYRGEWEVFDGRSYQKGAWVLHMLRHTLGEPVFRDLLREYIEAWRGPDQWPVTHDLRRMAEAVSGKDLGRFFDQWLYGAGWPKLDVSWDYRDNHVHLTVKQTQDVTPDWPLFRFPLPVVLVSADGVEDTHTVNVSRASQTFRLRSGVEPVRLRIDPGFTLLRELTVHQPEQAWLLQLDDADVIARQAALAHFGEMAKQDGHRSDRRRYCNAVASRLGDPFHRMRSEAAGTILDLARREKWVDSPDAPIAPRLMVLVNDRHEPNEARADALRALAHLGHDPARSLSQTMAVEGDRSYLLHAAALDALGVFDGEDALPTLRLALEVDSHRDGVRRAAISGIAKLAPEEGKQLAVLHAQYGNRSSLRSHCVHMLSERVPAEADVERFFCTLIDDPNWRLARTVIGVLQQKGSQPATLRALQEAREACNDRQLAQALRGAISALEGRLVDSD